MIGIVMGLGGAWGETGPAEGTLPEGFVYLSEVAPGVRQEVRYASTDNFVGVVIDGYAAARVVVVREVAEALREVQSELSREQFKLQVFDGYRPQRAVMHFVRWAQDSADQATKAEYYPHVAKEKLFARGYIALESGHSRGGTVDVTLLEQDATGHWREVDMGTPFDFFGPESWPSSTAVTPSQKANRLFLQRIMLKHGFASYEQEWWHFTLESEPFPETYFDFPIN